VTSVLSERRINIHAVNTIRSKTRAPASTSPSRSPTRQLNAVMETLRHIEGVTECIGFRGMLLSTLCTVPTKKKFKGFSLVLVYVLGLLG
jgi:hypothetical protein